MNFHSSSFLRQAGFRKEYVYIHLYIHTQTHTYIHTGKGKLTSETLLQPCLPLYPLENLQLLCEACALSFKTAAFSMTMMETN